MVFSLFLSRVLGMARDTVMTDQFGIGLATDSYRIAVQIPDTIFMLIAGGGLSSAFIPVFSELLHTDREKEAWKVFSVVVTVCSILAIALIAIAWGLAPAIVVFFNDKHPASIVPAAVDMSRIMLPAQFAFLVGSVLIATLYARKHFLAPGLAPNVYNLGIILAAAVLPGLMGLGIESMAWGALVGAMIGNVALPALAMIRVGSHFSPSLDVRHPGVRKFFALLLPVIFGFSLPSMVNLVTQKFASSYGTSGANTVLSLANNLMQAPLGIFGQSLALAVFPVLAEHVATKRMDLYRKQVSNTLCTVLYLGMMSGAIMLALAPQIVRVLYGHGAASHDPEQLSRAADCLRIYSLAIFAWCMQPVLMRGFFSLHKTLKPIAIGTVMTAVFIGMCFGATRISADYRLLPWATDIAAALLAIFLFFALEGDVGRLNRRALARTVIGSGLAALATALVAYVGGRLVGTHFGRLGDLAALVVFGLAGFWVFFFITKKLNMPETKHLSAMIDKINRRVRPVSQAEAGGE